MDSLNNSTPYNDNYFTISRTFNGNNKDPSKLRRESKYLIKNTNSFLEKWIMDHEEIYIIRGDSRRKAMETLQTKLQKEKSESTTVRIRLN